MRVTCDGSRAEPATNKRQASSAVQLATDNRMDQRQSKGKGKGKGKGKAKHALPADGCSGPLRCATRTAMPEDCGNEAEQLFALDVADADNFERVELKAKRRKQKTDSAVSAESQQLNDETTAAE